MKLIGIENALVDLVQEKASIEMIESYGLTLGDGKFFYALPKPKQKALLAMTDLKKIPGGSIANTIRIIGLLNQELGTDLSVNLWGKAGTDKLGDIFVKSIETNGAKFIGQRITDATTDFIYIFVTPDGQRTMCGRTVQSVDVEDIDVNLIEEGDIVYFSGYSFYITYENRLAKLKAKLDEIQKKGGKVAFSAASSSCVLDYKEKLLDLLENNINYFFLNDHEGQALTGQEKSQDIIDTLQKLAQKNKDLVIALTQGPRDTVAISHNQTVHVTPTYIGKERIIDTTGAGDAFSAGFLYAIIEGKSFQESLELGNAVAREIIKFLGTSFHKERIHKVAEELHLKIHS